MIHRPPHAWPVLGYMLSQHKCCQACSYWTCCL